mmetsp:Transcript_20968/g.60559  ORF Transcript_20968/g.60559 Transcript_20968/m.60559 type:complete len:297 (+) Transcript_20968:43-933(+)
MRHSRSWQSTPRLLAIAALRFSGWAVAEQSGQRSLSSRVAAAAASAQRSWWWPFESGGDDADDGDLHAAGGRTVVTDLVDGVTVRDEALPSLPPPRRRRRVSAIQSRHPRVRKASALAMGSGLVIPDAVESNAWRRRGDLHHLRAAPSAERLVREYDVDPEDMPAARRKPIAAPVTAAPRHPQESLVAANVAASEGTGSEGLQALTRTMMRQCMKFALWAKAQDLQGPELVRVWKSTCEPAVMAGAATERYKIMCEALGGAVAEFGKSKDWVPQVACMEVIQVFKESGVGGSPLKG